MRNTCQNWAPNTLTWKFVEKVIEDLKITFPVRCEATYGTLAGFSQREVQWFKFVPTFLIKS